MNTVLLLGTPASGVEVLGHHLNHLGLYSSEDQDRQMRHINRDLLDCLGGTETEPPVMQNGWWYRHDLYDLRRAAVKLLNSECDRILVLSDAAAALTLSFWKQFVSVCRYIVVINNPRTRYWDGSIEHQAKLWLRYAYSIKRAKLSSDIHMVINSERFADPDGTADELRRIVYFLGIEEDVPFLDKRLLTAGSELSSQWTSRQNSRDRLLKVMLPYELEMQVSELYELYSCEAERMIF
jgi:hypothetical protein